MVRYARLSIGSAAELSLDRCVVDSRPTTIYILCYSRTKCTANCAFCSQSRESSSELNQLSRIEWPLYELKSISNALKNSKSIKRICIQTLNYPNMFNDLLEIIKSIKKRSDLPISVSSNPLMEDQLKILKNLKIDRIGIPLDAATEFIFNRIKGINVKGPYTWDIHLTSLKKALSIFGKGKVSTHLIIGLGETEEEAVNCIQKLHEMGICTGLFAFTPIKGTLMQNNPRPTIIGYRRIQLSRYLITSEIITSNQMKFENGIIKDFGLNYDNLNMIIEGGVPFITSGCPDCNRPYYNERPSGPIFNFPHTLNKKEIQEVKKQLVC